MNPPGTKYRASCDGCYLAKVKCPKERPTCTRCKNAGKNCNYSPSQRAGKSRRPKVKVTPISQASEWSIHGQHGFQDVNMLHSPASTNPQQQQLGGASNFPSDCPSPHPSIPDAIWSENSPATTASSMLLDLDDMNFFTPWRDYLPSLDTELSLPESTTDSAGCFTNGSPTTTTTATTPSSTRISTPASQFSKVSEPPMRVSSPRLGTGCCNCITALAQALQIMQAKSAHPTTSTPSTLEIILEDNRDVVARGETLLRCSCFDDSTTIMLFTALIAKHLSFFGAFLSTTDLLESPLQPCPPQQQQQCPAATMPLLTTTTTTNPTPSSSSSSSSSTTYPSLTSRLTIGTYTLDAAGEDRLRIKIMMMELQKLASLLSRMRARLSALPVGYEGRTYETMVDFLERRLREGMDALRGLKKRVKGGGEEGGGGGGV